MNPKPNHLDKIAEGLRGRLGKRLDRLAALMQETAANELQACEQDEERDASIPAGFLDIFAREAADLAGEAEFLIEIIKTLDKVA